MDMTMLQQRSLAKELRMDPPPVHPETGEAVARVRVKVQCTPTQHVCCGQVFTAGTHTYEVWESELAAIEAEVDDASEADLALVDRDLANHETGVAAGRVMRDRPYKPAWAASFRRVMDRDPRPFRSIDLVVSKGKPAAKRGTA